jgi:hypothetical protein
MAVRRVRLQADLDAVRLSVFHFAVAQFSVISRQFSVLSLPLKLKTDNKELITALKGG